ncbi:FecCD family ABC transporter permease [Paenibacillus herberti]|uniref:Ferrichrome ABC transporter permease n=1 Tax=Paenibacillus herberti TaxID=1619309 RepID=A0A229NZ62_9BACL|nr:iron ABC transporter permease [Paenibacillus herberti]OXM15326.1 ferrichrome ABC transporter permease [Paenibacillus herberti]
MPTTSPSALREGGSNQGDTLPVKSRPAIAVVVILGGLIALAFSLALSISVGAANVSLATVWEAVFNYNPELQEHLIVHELRMPRALAGALTGACFAVAGALMQGMTRNPLADSGLLGLNSGAALALALCFAFAPGMPFMLIIVWCFVGAGVASGIVYGIGSLSRGGLTPVRLVLAGAAVSALFTALSEGIAIYYRIGQELAFWYAGGLAGTKWLQLDAILPWTAAALAGAMMMSRSITMLSLGEEVASGLGLNIGRTRVLALILVLVLAGTAVSAVGAVAFVGLLIPHVARYMVGVDYRYIIPASAVLGALLIVLADIASRMIAPPFESPIGALIALIGVPFFLYLARRERREL